MARRIGASVANVQTIESIVDQVGNPFLPRNDPFRELADEIEKCRKKVWHCVGDVEPPQRQLKKPKIESKPVASTTTNTSAYQSPKKGGSRADIEFKVNAMKVVQLREECKNRDLGTTGLKAELRERVLEHMVETTQQVSSDVQLSDARSPMKVVASVEVVDVDMKDAAPTVDDEQKMDPAPAQISCSSTQMEHHMPKQVAVATNSKHEQVSKDPPGQLERKRNEAEPARTNTSLEQPVQFASKANSPLRGFVEGSLKAATGIEKARAERSSPSDSIPEDDVSPPPSDITASTSSSKISGARVRELVSKLSSQPHYSASSISQSGGAGSALSKCVQAKKEARMARMAEIRGKSQQAKTFTASKSALQPKDHTSTLSSLKTSTASATNKKNLAAQMREKALRKENAPANQTVSSSAAGGKRALPLSKTLSKAMVPDSLGSTLKTGLGSTLKYGLSVAKKSKVAASPMDTYEISDRDDSDTDDSDSEAENSKRKKEIPNWARRDQLLPALEQQYLGCVNGQRVDPDDLFPEVQTCDLEAIFGAKTKNSKYRTRTSSGNWSRDKVTAAEKLVYKRNMGFAVETSEI